MAEGDENTDESQKTEDPTPRRLEEARKRGQVVNSKEVTNWVILFSATVMIGLAGPPMMSDLTETLRVFISRPHAFATDGLALRVMLRDVLLSIGAAVALPILLVAFVAALSVFLQIGPLFTAEPMKPDLSKISPLKGFGRLFSLRSVVEFLKGIAKLTLVGVVGVVVLIPYFDTVEHFIGQEMILALADLKFLFLRMMAAVLAVLFVIAVLDYIYQRFDFMKKMRMSKQEMKEEFKQTEGDPIIKSRLAQLRQTRARQRMMAAVPEADVVITNPTHYAVALKYDAKEMAAPTLVAKGTDAIAEKIREVAKEHKVPIVENAPLARALHGAMEIDQTIPTEHYKAVAEVISYVFRLKGKKL